MDAVGFGVFAQSMKRFFVFFAVLFFMSIGSRIANAELKKTDTVVRCCGMNINVLADSDGKCLFLPSCAPDDFSVSEQMEIFRGSLSSVFVILDGGDSAFTAMHAYQSAKYGGKITVIDRNGKIRYDGGLEKMWGHGLTSFQRRRPNEIKNSFNIKLEKKAELIEGVGKIKKYVLLSPRMWDSSRDKTGISQLSAFDIYNSLNEDGLPDICGEYVDLFVNGEYRGVYILCERMDKGGVFDVTPIGDSVSCNRIEYVTLNDYSIDGVEVKSIKYNPNAAVDEGTDISGGYVIEIMFEQPQECGFVTKGGGVYGIKYPENCSLEMVEYIASYIQSFENALSSSDGYYNGKHITDYADLKSLADQILLYSFCANGEIYRTSTYMYKDVGEKLYFGPVWDFETAYYSLESCETFLPDWVYTVQQQFNLVEKVWKWGDFMSLMAKENARMRKIFANTVNNVIPQIIADASESWRMNKRRWNWDETNKNYGVECAKYVSALITRANFWYDSVWNGDEYLMGVSVLKKHNGDGTVTLVADISGRCDGRIVWYKLVGDSTKMIEIGTFSLTVEADGSEYYCVAYGKNCAYSSESVSSVFASPQIEMRSFGVKADRQENETVSDSRDSIGKKQSGKIVAVLAVPVLALIAVAVALLISIKQRRKTV